MPGQVVRMNTYCWECAQIIRCAKILLIVYFFIFSIPCKNLRGQKLQKVWGWGAASPPRLPPPSTTPIASFPLPLSSTPPFKRHGKGPLVQFPGRNATRTPFMVLCLTVGPQWRMLVNSGGQPSFPYLQHFLTMKSQCHRLPLVTIQR